MVTSFLTRLGALVRRRTADAELDEEMRYHLEREIERNVANGMPPADARAAAQRAFGNLTIATEQARDAWRWRRLEELRQDVRYALRTFRRAPGFVLTVAATIGLGLGLLTTVFTVFDAYVLRSLAVRDPHTLFEILWYAENGTGHSFTWTQYQALQANRDALHETFAYSNHFTRLRGSATLGQLVTGNYFEMLGVPPALGRTLLPSDAAPPTDGSVIVLSHRTWQSVFGGDSSIVGQRIRVSGVPLTVVGVAREGFGGLGSVPSDFWIPITAARALGAGPDPFSNSAAEALSVVGRLTPGSTSDEATPRVLAVLRATTADRPAPRRAHSVVFVPRGTAIAATRDVYQLFSPIAAAFVLVMLIACANVANLMLARGFSRQREMGIRLALGAGRGRLTRQLLTEAVLLAVPAAAIGFVLSRAALDVGIRVIFATVPPAYAEYLRVIPLAADVRTAVFMVGSAALAAIAFGLVPALQSTHPNIVQASRGDFDTAFRPSRLRNGLVVAQVTLSVLLLVSAGVLLGNARRTGERDPGVRTRDVLQIDVRDSSRGRILAALRRDARVLGVASAMSAPLDGGWWVISVANARGTTEGANANLVSPEYFGTVGLRLTRGRTFTREEAMARAPVVVVSEAAVARYWGDRDPIGEVILQPAADSTPFAAFRRATVIGVVANAIPGSIVRPLAWPTVYYPQTADARGSRVLVRVAGDADRLGPLLSRELGLVEMHSLAVSFALQVYPFRMAYWIASAIGAIALVLTLTGVYGVLAYVVTGRRREFGIRLALGAEGSALVALVFRESLRLAAIGLGIGLALAVGLAKILTGSVFISNAFEPAGYAGGALVVLVACAVAGYVPSRRAAQVDPVHALRADS